jgi:hypothetical protein
MQTQSKRRLALLSILLTLSFPIKASGESPLLELRVELLTQKPLPFQPVRLRLALANTGKKALSGLCALELFPYMDTVTSDGRGGAEPYSAFAPLSTVSLPSFPGSAASYYRLTLQPGEVETISSHVLPGLITSEHGDVILTRPGKYELLLYYYEAVREQRVDAKPLVIQVGQPSEDEAQVYKLLVEDRTLAAVMASNRVPDRDHFQDGSTRFNAGTVEKLKSIVDKYPRCSYAPFARYALGRHYALEARLREAAAKGPTQESQASYREANAVLEAIDCTSFVYGSNVLMLRLELAADDAARGKLIADLGRIFGDDRDWLQSRESELASLLYVMKAMTRDADETMKIDALLKDVHIKEAWGKAFPYLKERLFKRVRELERAGQLPVNHGPRSWKPPANKK